MDFVMTRTGEFRIGTEAAASAVCLPVRAGLAVSSLSLRLRCP